MTVLKTILLIINILSFSGVVIVLPIAIIDYFAVGSTGRKSVFKNLDYKYIDTFCLICLAVALTSYMIRNLLK